MRFLAEVNVVQTLSHTAAHDTVSCCVSLPCVAGMRKISSLREETASAMVYTLNIAVLSVTAFGVRKIEVEDILFPNLQHAPTSKPQAGRSQDQSCRPAKLLATYPLLLQD